MKIIDLLEELQKHNEEEIEFMIYDKDGESPRQLKLFIIDGRFIFKWMNKDGEPTNRVVLALMEDPNSFLVK